jgi:hypothetical protein
MILYEPFKWQEEPTQIQIFISHTLFPGTLVKKITYISSIIREYSGGVNAISAFCENFWGKK